MNSSWSLTLSSPDPSPSWESYAERYSALLNAIAVGLPGEVSWSDYVKGTTVPLDLHDTKRITQILSDGQLYNDADELMLGAGSRLWLTARRVWSARTTTVRLSGGMGGDDPPAVGVSLEVKEPGEALWSYPDEAIAKLIAEMLAAIDGDKARARDRFLHRLLIKAEAPFEVGSHVYMTAPLDDPGRFPQGARQVRCGGGWLLIVPPGATDDETVQRMRWVAAAIGAG